MIKLENRLIRKLQAKRIQIEITNGDTITLWKVPTNRCFFNKSLTNLLIKKDKKEQLAFIFVDENLEYSGRDKALLRVFAASFKQARWRVLWFGPEKHDDLGSIVRIALTALGFDGQPPVLPSHAALQQKKEEIKQHSGLLRAFGINLTKLIVEGKNIPTIGREEEIEQIASSVQRWGQTRLALIVGDSGVGKTNLLTAVARKLSEHQRPLNLIAIHLADLLAATVPGQHVCALLTDLLDNQRIPADTIVALEHIELALAKPQGNLILVQFLDKGGTLIGTTLPQYLPAFQTSPLARRVQVIDLPEMTPTQTEPVLTAMCEQIISYYHVEINDFCISACIRAAQQLAGYFPAKAIALLDAAVARAVKAGAKIIGPDDIYFTAQRFLTGMD